MHGQTSAESGIKARRMHQAAKPVYSLPPVPLVIELLDLAVAGKAVLWVSLWNGVVSLAGIYHLRDVLVAVMSKFRTHKHLLKLYFSSALYLLSSKNEAAFESL